MEWLHACHPLSLLLQTDRKGHRFQPLTYLITNMINRIEIMLKLYGSGSKVPGTPCWVRIDWIRLDGYYSAPKCCIWIFPPSVANFETFPPWSFPTLKSRPLGPCANTPWTWNQAPEVYHYYNCYFYNNAFILFYFKYYFFYKKI